MSKESWNNELSKYIEQSEPVKTERAENWKTAIGLQQVDGLSPSNYLIDTAKEHIEGNINIDEVKLRINNYYESLNEAKLEEEKNVEEADKVSARIAEVLGEKSFNFNPTELFNIHGKLFCDVYHHAGKIRECDIIKKEWVLDNDTITYASTDAILPALEYDFHIEKNFSYKNLSLEEAINHLCRFTSNIWQVHPFREGNTRTVAVFIIKYLKTFGFDINFDVFAKNSWYFRNALVRANYKNFEKNIFEDLSFLEKFFYNLLSGTNYELKNRYTHIDYQQDSNVERISNNEYTLEEQAIINIIKKNSFVKQEEIAKEINKSIRTVKNRMIELQEKRVIERKNGKRNGEWIIL